MQQIAGWLEKLGLEQYAPRFAENDINFAILSDLSDQDLKELGVSSLGHRRSCCARLPSSTTHRPVRPRPFPRRRPRRRLRPANTAPVAPRPRPGWSTW